MNSPIELHFSTSGNWPTPRHAGAECLSDAAIAEYLDGSAAPGVLYQIAARAQRCPACFELLRAAIDSVGARRPAEARPFRVLARLRQRGLEILNALELRLWALTDAPVPALGTLRGGDRCDLVSIVGPGSGLDELELQAQADGTARLVVRGAAPEAAAGERIALVLSTDGEIRERRPFDALRPEAFARLAPGRHEVQLTARAPGGEPRVLSRVALDLTR